MADFDFDAAGRLIGGSGRETFPFELSEGETEVLRVVGSKRPGGLTSVGGDLVLTNFRVLFTPLNTGDVSRLLAFALGKAGADGRIVGIVDKIQDMIGTAAPIGTGALSKITSIETGTNGSLLKPPTLIISGTDGSSEEVGVLASRGSFNPSPKNRAARDQFLLAARRQLGL
ncbi:hypothetical protein [Paenarthrobacter ureafaciens]|uniref:hypothetical protein n=1 Tax=Paenarthrobacter ureafaciens TaxID=37931 RepID=UPI00140875C3|nr:hypothetical protein [Paenarthrobacter ureafaciens]MCX8453708.1 hypothetical protein [Paenarthrobacter ureafaciens]MCY0973367.1 hypothetical protein [Paenarthrobacter ureafaciens]